MVNMFVQKICFRNISTNIKIEIQVYLRIVIVEIFRYLLRLQQGTIQPNYAIFVERTHKQK